MKRINLENDGCLHKIIVVVVIIIIIVVVFSFIHKKNEVLLSHIYNFILKKAINRLFRPAQKNSQYEKLIQIFKTNSNIQ